MAGKRKTRWQKKFGAAAKAVHRACKRSGKRGKAYKKCVSTGMKRALR